MREVGVRELRAHLKDVLDEVEKGESVVLTRGGKPVAKVSPMHAELPPEVARLLASGRATWGGRTFADLPRPIKLIGEGPSLSEMILEDREPILSQDRDADALP